MEGVADLLHQDQNHIALVLFPQYYGGADDVKLLKQGRTLEDRLMAHTLSMKYEGSVFYTLADEHGSEKRRLSQKMRICFSNALGVEPPWFESQSFRGRIGPVPLVKVRDMIIPGTSPASRERKLAPGARLCQRGIDACVQVIDELKAGLPLQSGDKVMIVEVITMGIAEWGRAVWKQQQATTAASNVLIWVPRHLSRGRRSW